MPKPTPRQDVTRPGSSFHACFPTTLLAPTLARTAQLPQSSGDPAAAARHRRTSCPTLRRPLSTSLPSRRHFIESGQAVRATSTSRATNHIFASAARSSNRPLLAASDCSHKLRRVRLQHHPNRRSLIAPTWTPNGRTLELRRVSSEVMCRSLPATPSGTSAPAIGCHQRHVHLTSCKYSKLWPHSRATQNPARHTRRCCHRPSLAGQPSLPQVLPAESSRHCCRNSRACNLTWHCPSTIVSNNPRGKSVDEPTTARIRRLRKLPKHVMRVPLSSLASEITHSVFASSKNPHCRGTRVTHSRRP